MQTKQYHVKIFEITIDAYDEFFAFIQKNKVLLQRYLLLLKGNVTPEVRRYLDQVGLAWSDDETLAGQGTAGGDSKPAVATGSFTRQSGLEIVDTLVRSGVAVETSKDVLVLKRVNSGATIATDGNLIALAPIEGLVKCNGDFMLIKPTGKARILFNGVDITDAMETDHFYKIRMTDDEILITPYAKDIQWA
jgi:septum site-determining protein MinC